MRLKWTFYEMERWKKKILTTVYAIAMNTSDFVVFKEYLSLSAYWKFFPEDFSSLFIVIISQLTLSSYVSFAFKFTLG